MEKKIVKSKALIEREKQLNMSLGKANYKLQKEIIFNLVKKCNFDTCFRCKQKIRFINELSYDHKINWLKSENSFDLFFDMNNVTFSHLECNSKASDNSTKRFEGSNKSEKLGMNISTANGRLRKMILFNLIETCNLLNCFRCDKKMNYENFTIEHKENWLHSKNPFELYFDLNNISFSHYKCNVSSRRGKMCFDNKSGLKGVSYEKTAKRKKRWKAQISIGKEVLFIGRFETKEEAGRAFDEKMIALYGENAITNRSLGLL